VFSEVIGLTTPQILAIAVLDRVILFIVIFVLWIIYGRKSNYQIDENPGVV